MGTKAATMFRAEYPQRLRVPGTGTCRQSVTLDGRLTGLFFLINFQGDETKAALSLNQE